MSAELVDKVTNHLEFMGYGLEDLKGKSGHLYLATHDDKPTMVVFVSNDLVTLRAQFSGLDKRALKSKDFYHALNSTNANANITKWFYSETDNGEVNLVIEATDFEYEKKSFSKLIEMINAETRAGISGFDSFFEE